MASAGPSRDEPPARELEVYALYARAVHQRNGLLPDGASTVDAQPEDLVEVRLVR